MIFLGFPKDLLGFVQGFWETFWAPIMAAKLCFCTSLSTVPACEGVAIPCACQAGDSRYSSPGMPRNYLEFGRILLRFLL